LVTIRPEREQDRDSIYDVNLKAFGREIEPRLVEAIRGSECFIPELSLVAIEDDEVVAHIMFSAISIKTEKGDVPALALAPIAALPSHQKRGIGSKLVERGLAESKRLGHKVVIVIGHPEYYPRFGFEPARRKGFEVPIEVPDEAFMAIELVPDALVGISGMVIYPPYFDGA
jgi:putative acetyltransferase